MAKTDPKDLEASVSELEGEHRHIGELLERLSATTDAAGLAPTLSELRKVLADHFSHEEQPGGLYDRLGVVSPQFRDRVRALVDDHFRVLSTVRTLEKQAAETTPDALARARGLKTLLAEHEAREKELVSLARRA